MKSKNRDCTTNMQWLCKTWRQNRFKVIQAKPNQLRRRREALEHYQVKKKTQDQFIRTSLSIFQSLRRPELESGEIYAAQNRNRGNCSTSRRIAVLLLSSLCARPTSRWPATLRMAVQSTIKNPKDITAWSYDMQSHAQKFVERYSLKFPHNVWTTTSQKQKI